MAAVVRLLQVREQQCPRSLSLALLLAATGRCRHAGEDVVDQGLGSEAQRVQVAGSDATVGKDGENGRSRR